MREILYHPGLDVSLLFHPRTVEHYRRNGWISLPEVREDHADHQESPTTGDEDTEDQEN